QQLPADSRATDVASLRLASPVATPTASMPTHNSFGLDDVQGRSPGSEQSQHGDPEDALLIVELGSLYAASEDGDLLAKSKVLKEQLLSASEQRPSQGEKDREGVHGAFVAARSGRIGRRVLRRSQSMLEQVGWTFWEAQDSTMDSLRRSKPPHHGYDALLPAPTPRPRQPSSP
ncbi:MAG: hypothetical protein ACI9EF_003626, partial [Pseudohongiellaceae bacterium]